VEQDLSEDHRIAQTGRELRGFLAQSLLQSMVNPELKPGFSGRDMKASNEGDRNKNLAEDKLSNSHCFLLIQRSSHYFSIEGNQLGQL